MKRDGIFGDDELGSLDGADRLWGAQPAAKDHEVRFIVCDVRGCRENIPVQLKEISQHCGAAVVHQGWVISDHTDLCPEHAKNLPPEVEVVFGTEEEEEEIETPPPAPPPVHAPPQRSAWSQIAPMLLALLFLAMAVTLMWVWERMLLDEQDMTYAHEAKFISEHFILPNHCSGYQIERCDGIMATPGQPQIPVRYTCDKDACSFDCK